MMNYSGTCISDPFANAVMSSGGVFSWPLTVPHQTVLNNTVNMSSVTQCCHPTGGGMFQNFPVNVSDRPDEQQPQGIVLYYTGVPAFTTQLNQPSNNEVENPSSGTEGENAQGKKDKPPIPFPWMNTFPKLCCAAVGNKSIKELENLLTTYIEHVTPHFSQCQNLPNKAAKLKRNVSETMVFLHLLYTDLHEPPDNFVYHEKMSQLMAMLLDLEITASSRGKDTMREISNRLSSTLYIFLDRSDDYILDALLRTQLINKRSKSLCHPFLRKVLTELVVRRPISALTYVRYLLVFKLWKNVVADVNEKKTINKIALQRLHPPPKFFQDHDIAKPSYEILPKVPRSNQNCTQFYLLAKFNLKDSSRAFFRFCRDSQCQEDVICASPSYSIRAEEDENGCLSVINEIWSSLSNGTTDEIPLLGKLEVFSEDRMFSDSIDTNLSEADEIVEIPECWPKSNKKVESPDSGVGLDEKEKIALTNEPKTNDGESDKVPDSTYKMYPDCQEIRINEESTDVDTISDASPQPSSTVTVSVVSVQQADEPIDRAFHDHDHDQDRRFNEVAVEVPVLSDSAATATPPPALSETEGFILSPSCVYAVTPCAEPVAITIVQEESPFVDHIDSETSTQGEFGEGTAADHPSNGPNHHRLDDVLCAPYPVTPSAQNVSLSELRCPETLTYQEVLRNSGGGAEAEWRRYSELVAMSENYRSKLDGSVEDHMLADDADGSHSYHSSSNCHLPLKKRKLAASSNESPSVESTQGLSSPYLNDADVAADVAAEPSDYQFQQNLLNDARGQLNYVVERRDYVVERESGYQLHWNSLPESRQIRLDQSSQVSGERANVDQLRFHPAGRINNIEYAPASHEEQKNGPTDLSTASSSYVQSTERVYAPTRKSVEEYYGAVDPRSIPQSLVGVRSHGNIGHTSPHASAEVPDNLNILVEQAVRRIWEEREQLPTALATPQTSGVSQYWGKEDRAASYPTGRAMSLAEAYDQPKSLEESVIVRNDKHQYYKDQFEMNNGRVHSNSSHIQYHSNTNQMSDRKSSDEGAFGNIQFNHQVNGGRPQVGIDLTNSTQQRRMSFSNDVVANGYGYREQNPIDMFGKRRSHDVNLPYSRVVSDQSNERSLSTLVTPERLQCRGCRRPSCNGKKCKSKEEVSDGVLVPLPYSQNVLDQTDYNRVSDTMSRQQETPAKIACRKCRRPSCSGKRCKAKEEVSDGVLVPVPFSREVLTGNERVQGPVGRHQVTSEKIACTKCRRPSCSGKRCKAKEEVLDEVVTSPNSHRKKYKCSNCRSSKCAGTCAKLPPSNNNKALKKCALCNFASCNGSCILKTYNMSDTSTNAYRSAASGKCQYCRKSGCDSSCLSLANNCDVCRTACKGKCKANQNDPLNQSQVQVMHSYATIKIVKCKYCKSLCLGTCRIAQKNHMEEKKACEFCSQESCSGSCQHTHSMDSILGSSSSSSVSNVQPASRSKRRTRSSQSRKPAPPREEKKLPPEPKRRKKSVSR